MSRPAQAPHGAGLAPPSAGRGATGAGWPLVLLLLAAAGAALPDLFDLDAFKTAVVALLAAAVLLPWMALAARAELRAWLASAGGRLALLSAALAVPAALGHPWSAPVADRVLLVVLCTLAASLGLRAARLAAAAHATELPDGAAAEDGGRLLAALQYATLVTAVIVLLQAAGIEKHFAPATEDFLQRELVGLMGNSTRAGALLALGVVAAFAAATHAALAERASSLRLALATLTLGTAALVLTRARGGWLGAGVGITVVAAVDSRAVLARARLWLPRMAVGVALAALLAGGTAVFTAGKLPGSAPVLSGNDVTAHVRLAVWRATGHMIAERPLLGFGLGSFRAEFPPFRDPAEAALPGLGGAATEVDHPHDEFLLAAAEGGLLAGLALAAFAALTLLHGWRLARAPSPPLLARLALGTFAAAVVAASVQNAWMSPGTALPAFAAAGAVWGLRRHGRGGDDAPDESPALRAATVALLLGAIAALVLLALPRLDAQLRLRAFYLRANAEGVGADNLPLLVEAAQADPGDINVQRLLAVYGAQLMAARPASAPAFAAAVAAARARIAVLAPHVPPPPETVPAPSAAPAPR